MFLKVIHEKKKKVILLLSIVGITFTYPIIAIYMQPDLPYTNLSWLISLYALILLAYILATPLMIKKRLLLIGISFILSCGCWLLLSYTSYYSGVRNTMNTNAVTLYNTVSYMLRGNFSDEQKKVFIDELFVYLQENRKTHIVLKKNGEIYAEKNFNYLPDGYILEYVGKSYPSENKAALKPFPIIYVGDDEYELTYEFINKPQFFTGLSRAFLISVNEDFTGDHFLLYRNYERSINFVVPFILLVFGLLWIFSSREQIREKNNELEIANNKLIEKNRQLRIFESTFNKIKSDYNSIVSNSKNNLQPLQSSWDEMEKSETGLSRHDAINRILAIRNNDIKDDNAIHLVMEELKDWVYEFILEPCIRKIQQELRGLDVVLDMTPTDVSLKEIVEQIDDTVPERIKNNENEYRKYKKILNGAFDEEAKCNIIFSRLQSIVFNLVENSLKAIDVFEDDADDEYIGEVTVEISQEQSPVNRLCIKFRDNGGGFPIEVLPRIYREPVATTKDNRKHGEGTAYIGFFVELMKGEITAKNVINDGGERGAETTIYIPINEG